MLNIRDVFSELDAVKAGETAKQLYERVASARGRRDLPVAWVPLPSLPVCDRSRARCEHGPCRAVPRGATRGLLAKWRTAASDADAGG